MAIGEEAFAAVAAAPYIVHNAWYLAEHDLRGEDFPTVHVGVGVVATLELSLGPWLRARGGVCGGV